MPLLLTVGEVAELFGVVVQTVYTHQKEGRLTAASTTPLRFESKHVHSVKLLHESDIAEGSTHDIPRARALAAKLAGVVDPSEDGKYSLDDVARLRAWDPSAAPPAGSGDPPDEGPETPQTATTRLVEGPPGALAGSRGEMLERYLREQGSPNELPDDFWLTPLPPVFIPPRGLYREVVQGWVPITSDDAQGWCENHRKTRLWRSGHYRLEEGRLIWTPPGPVFTYQNVDREPSPPPPLVGVPLPEARFNNERWRQARIEWLFAWERRREHRRLHRGDAGGHLVVTTTGVDREAILHEYHMFYDRPGDLPPEFWAGQPEQPPFEAPTNAFLYRLGQRVWNEARRPMTQVIRSAGWLGVELDDEGPVFCPEEAESAFDGHFEEDYPHPVIAEWNAFYETALREWTPAWLQYQAFSTKFR